MALIICMNTDKTKDFYLLGQFRQLRSTASGIHLSP